jgi:hypothetical protein
MTTNEMNAETKVEKKTGLNNFSGAFFDIDYMQPKELDKDIKIMKEYLLLKFREQDWHGVADAAMDLREMEVKRKQ